MNQDKKLEDYLYYEEKDPDLKIYCGDCLEIMPLLPKVDLIVTDPPYGIDFLSARPKEGKKKEKIHNDKYEDYLSLLPKMFSAFKEVLNDGGCCCCCCGGGTPALAHLWIEAKKWLDVENVCVWDKGFVGMGWRYRFQWESILIATKGERKTWNGGTNVSNVIKIQKDIPQAGEHPTPKPVSLMRLFIEHNSNELDLILDPFMGGGTTLIACKEDMRNGIGIEISEKYCSIAKKRIKATCKPLFTSANGAEKNLKTNEKQSVMPFVAE